MSFAPALWHSPITRVAPGVHIVRGAFRMAPGFVIGRTMTIIEADDGLAIFNAVRLSEKGEAELGTLGKVKHLVKLSDSHGIDEPFYVHRYEPEVWATPRAKLERITRTRTLGPDGPVRGGVVIDYPGTSGWVECGYLVPEGDGTLVTCDALQNHVDDEGASLLGRMTASLLGFKGGLKVAPMWRRYQKIAGEQVREAFAALRDRPFANLVTGHGPPVVGGADVRAREAVEAASA